MNTIYIRPGQIEPIRTMTLSDRYGNKLTGLTDIKLKVQRESDGLFLDWSDMTFKIGAAVITLDQVMSELDSVRLPGIYQYVFDTGAVRPAPDTDAIYSLIVDQTALTNVFNVPQESELRIGQWVSDIVENTEDIENKIDIANSNISALDADVVIVDSIVDSIASSVATANDKLDDVLGDLSDKPYVVYQSYSYDKINETITGLIWVERAGLIVTNPISVSIIWYNASGSSVLTMVDSSPDAQGIFKVTGVLSLALNTSYYAVASIVTSGLGTLKSAKGIFTAG